MIRLSYIPRYSELDEYYGNPDPHGTGKHDPQWLSDCTDLYDLPYPMRKSWDLDGKPVNRLRFHRLVGPSIIDALADVRALYGSYMIDQGWNVLGDALNLRKMISTDKLSTHAWGISIDVNNHIACWQCPPDTQPKYFVDAFKARGFVWGGDWKPPNEDPMHFQAAK